MMLLSMLLAAGCNTFSGAPHLRDTAIDPAQLKPGDRALITVKVSDRHKLIKRIEGKIKEEPQITLTLNDKGENGDVKKDDGIWSLEVDVPAQAPAGDFVVEFTAYGRDGHPVPVRDKGKKVPLAVTLPISIKYTQ
jgi:methionine-rich copper-binding protein CopC